MAALLEQKPDFSAKFGTQVDEQIAQATSRIRVHDLILGGLSLASLVAIYATTMILLDKYLNLPEWVRQISLLGFLGLFAGVGYFLVVRPLRNRINPLYAAALVEDTLDDAKNSVTGYVDAQEKGNVPGAVRAAMSAKAAKAVGEADVNRAVDHRSLLVAGGILIAFLITLTVLFFVFRPTQFKSLVARTFTPYSSKAIASRTQISLLKPDPAEATLTTGQTITVAVHIGGRVPAKTDPTRVRLLLRHNPTDPTYEELPLQEGETTRDWNLKVPEYLVQNGFWYKIAAGDSETQEYKVTVRSLPLFTDFEVSYDYPKYTRRLADKSTDPNIRAYRGTKVTLLARTNREVKDGLMKFVSGPAPIAGKVAAGKPDTLAFTFTATDSTQYRLSMLTTSGERNSDTLPFSINLDSDFPPRIEITKPEEPETTVPANGQLVVDGTVGDDFGIDKVRLRLRVENRDLAPVPYEGGKSFFRTKDGTWPNDLTYKGSVDLPKLAFADGQKFEPKEGMVIEFWLEAIDNCTETKPVEGWGDKPQPGQVGKSEPRKVRLSAPITEPEDKKQHDQQAKQRQNEEKKHNEQQQQKLENEKRDPPQDQDQGQQPKKDEKKDEQSKKGDNPETKKDGTDPKNGEPKKGDNPETKKDGTDPKMGDPNGTGMNDPMPMPKNGDNKNPPEKNPPEKKGSNGMGGNDPKNPMTPPDAKKDPGGMGNTGGKDPKTPDMKTDTSPKGGDNTGMGGMNDTGMKQPPETAPPPKSEDDKKAAQDAERVKNQLDKNKSEGGDAKQNPNENANSEDRNNAAQPKPQQPMPMNGGQESQPKEGPKPADPKNPNNPKDDKNGASQNKPEGKLEQPPDKNAQPKPDPKSQPEGSKGNTSERREEPLGGNPGEDKPEPKKGENPQPKEPGKDPMSGSTGKPPTDQKPGDPKDGGPKGGNPNEKQNPADNAASTKPNVEPARGQDKNPGKEKSGSKPEPNAGDAKPDKAPPSAETKPAQPQGAPQGKQPDASEDKGAPKEPKDPMNPKAGGVSDTKPEPKKPMGGMGEMGEDKVGEPGMEKPTPKKDGAQQSGNSDPKEPKGPKGAGKKLDEKQLKELQDAARDLNNPDPAKRKDAQDKLDKAIGEKNRKDLEQTAKDLESPDKATREAAQKKIDDLKQKAEEQAKKDGKDGDEGKGTDKGKGKELTKQEIDELAKKADDLTSKDDKKREAAEKEFDQKVGKEAREKIQEELKKQPPMNPMDPKEQDDLRKQIEEQAKRHPRGKGDKTDELTPGGGATSDPAGPEDPTDPKNKLKSAQLQLEDFEKNRYNKDLQDKLGWTQQQYDEFLKAQAERVKQLEAEQAKLDKEAREQPPSAAEPTIKAGGSSKVDSNPTTLGSGATGTGAVFAPPGFEDAKKRFAEEMRKLQQKK